MEQWQEDIFRAVGSISMVSCDQCLFDITKDKVLCGP